MSRIDTERRTECVVAANNAEEPQTVQTVQLETYTPSVRTDRSG